MFSFADGEKKTIIFYHIEQNQIIPRGTIVAADVTNKIQLFWNLIKK